MTVNLVFGQIQLSRVSIPGLVIYIYLFCFNVGKNILNFAIKNNLNFWVVIDSILFTAMELDAHSQLIMKEFYCHNV